MNKYIYAYKFLGDLSKSKSGFPLRGHEQQMGHRGPRGHSLKFTLDILELLMKSKKKFRYFLW